MRCAELLTICVTVQTCSICIAVWIRSILNRVTVCTRPAAAAVAGLGIVAGSALCGDLVIVIVVAFIIIIITAGGPQGLEGAARSLPVWCCDCLLPPTTGDWRQSG